MDVAHCCAVSDTGESVCHSEFPVAPFRQVNGSEAIVFFCI